MAITYSIRVGWATQGLTNQGLFNGRTTTAYDDITADVKTYKVNRGRQTPDDVINASTATITLADTTGKYNVFNNNGPLFAYLLPMRTVWIRASVDGGSTWSDRYFGFIRSITYDVLNRQSTIECIDAFIYLQSVLPTVASLGATTTGNAILNILNAAFNTSITINLALGDAIPDFVADGTTSALSRINDLLTTSLGLFFIDRSGSITYLDRYAGNRSPRNAVQATLINMVKNITPSVTMDHILNGGHALRTPGGVQQNYSDATSQNTFGRVDNPLVTSPYFTDDNQVLAYCQYIVQTHKNALGQTKYADLMYRGLGDAMDLAIFARDVGDHINIQDTLAQLNNDYDIVGIQETAVPGSNFNMTWVLYTRNIYGLPIIMNQSTFNSTDVFVY